MATVPLVGLIAIGFRLGVAVFFFTVVGAGLARGGQSRLGAEDEEESDRPDDQENKNGQRQGQPTRYAQPPAARPAAGKHAAKTTFSKAVAVPAGERTGVSLGGFQ
jgi:hypothetical protein